MFGSLRNGEEVYNKLIGRRIGEAEDAVLNESNQVCVFKPGVQVKDNWGWCNGSCDYGFPNSGLKYGCYSDGLIIDFCDPGKIEDFDYYKGAIVVIP